jgi:hypothetical protein
MVGWSSTPALEEALRSGGRCGDDPLDQFRPQAGRCLYLRSEQEWPATWLATHFDKWKPSELRGCGDVQLLRLHYENFPESISGPLRPHGFCRIESISIPTGGVN